MGTEDDFKAEEYRQGRKGWRAQPQTTFIVGMLLGFGCAFLVFVLALLWLP